MMSGVPTAQRLAAPRNKSYIATLFFFSFDSDAFVPHMDFLNPGESLASLYFLSLRLLCEE